MKLKQRQVPFKIKELDQSGEFSGYLSVFGNTDSYRDVMMPGAFDDSLASYEADGTMPPLLWQHNSMQPIGPFTKLKPDDVGLYCEGRMLIGEIQQAREAYALTKNKVIRGMSIGYSVDDEQYDGKTNVNQLLAVTLWEGSLVTFPANVEAMITEIKTAFVSGNLPSVQEFESSLRDALSCSRSEAKVIASQGFVKLLELRDADKKQVDTAQAEIDSVLAAIRNFSHA